MKNKIENIHVNYSEYSYFNYISKQEAINYFFNLYDEHKPTSVNLSQFFDELTITSVDAESVVNIDSVPNSLDRVDVMIDDEFLMVEANSLKAIRIILTRFMESGYMLRRDRETEKMFKKDKTTRYIRVFYIIDQISGICLN
jgi:uncharacterized protein YllA (UPF0747 family)|tara:strand:+ start:1436 stop:1861 length:426 start_codon:yes stop_codon:yes gene_type:complete